MTVVAGVYCLWRPRLTCSRWLPPRASSASASASASAFASASDLVKQTVSSHDIVIFSKTYCPYCGTAKDVFKELKQEPYVLELDDRDDGPDIQDALSQLVGRNTVPQVFVHGEHLGGCDDTIEAYENGRLLTLLGINSKGAP